MNISINKKCNSNRIWLNRLTSALFFITCSAVSSGYCLEPPPVTPVDKFFVINNYGIPAIPEDWHLIVGGEAENPLSLTLDDLKAYPAEIRMATLECINNPLTVGMLIGNANWTGVPLHVILEKAHPASTAQSISFFAVDGYSIGPLNLQDILQRDDILLAYQINEIELPVEQGYPLRLVLPGVIGSNWLQWLERIEISTTAPVTTLPIIPIHTQIYLPQNGETIITGSHSISGMALIGNGREIAKVAVSIDGGSSWQPAKLLTYFVPNVWKMWEYTWEVAQAGQYRIVVRAQDDQGNTQVNDGWLYGWASIMVTVTQGCINDDDCDDGVFCNGEEKCINGKCVQDPSPCSDEQVCKEEVKQCWDAINITATSLQKRVLRPILRDTKCLWLVVVSHQNNHFHPGRSIIEAVGSGAGAQGVSINTRWKAFGIGRLIFIPVCVERGASVGQWSILVKTDVGNIPLEETIMTMFQVR
jgi:DMSO/TMAO reductase YedYZ molybdopterin-dependent catalytic subunit